MRVVVAEDERYVRATILSILPYHKMKITVVAEASDGNEALEYCRDYKPDVLITDIRMPGISGLDLIERVAEICPELQIIIISGYDSFEYAKRAMSLGVKHYLLKPVEEEDLNKALSSVQLDIENKIKENDNAIELQHKLEKLLPLSIEKFLNLLVRNDSCLDGRFYTGLKEAGIVFEYPYFSVITAEKTNDIEVVNYASCEQYVCKSRDFSYYKAMDYQRENASFFIINHSFCMDEYTTKVMEVVNHLIQQHLRFGTIGISGTTQKINTLDSLYEQALCASELHFWNEQSTVFFYTADSFREFEDFSYRRVTIAKKLVDCLRLNKPEEGLQIVLNLIEELCGFEQKINPTAFKDFIFLILCDVAKELDMEYMNNLKESKINHQIYNSRSIVQIKGIIQSIIKNFTSIYQSKLAVESPVIGIKRLIEQNPESDYSLEQLAKYAGYHLTHFSELFKSEVGIGFAEFKKTVKMNYAKELLKTTNLKIDHIAECLGYNDSKYFIRIFKTYFLESPAQYRKKYTLCPKK